MKNFNKFINEAKGISEINKICTDYFIEYYKNFGYAEIVVGDIDDQRLPLINCLLDIKKGETHAKFDPSDSFIRKVENGSFFLYNVIFRLSIEDDGDVWLLKELISHELNHCIEFYKIKKWNQENKINDKVVEIMPNHLAIQKSIININVELTNPFSFFKHLIYLSLDHEYNSRVAQLFQYLKSFNTKDKNILKEKLKMSRSYMCYIQLEEFSSEEFIRKCVYKIGEQALIEITKDLNIQLKNNNINKLVSLNFINDNLLNLNDLISYYKKWEKLFKFKNKEHLNNLYRMIDEVINENGLREGYISEGVDKNSF